MKTLVAGLILSWGVISPVLAQRVEGFWYDERSRGYFEFVGDSCGDLNYYTPQGLEEEGTFKAETPDKEGNRTFRAKVKHVKTGTSRDLYFKIMTDGRRGFVMHRCTKTLIFRNIDQ